MPPLEQPIVAASSKVEWNKVTWYSKLLAVLFFVAFVCGGFFFGMWYQQQLAPATVVQDETLAIATTNSETVAIVGAVPWMSPTSTDSIYLEKEGKMYVNNPDG